MNAFLRHETARSEEIFCSVRRPGLSPLDSLDALLRELGGRIRSPSGLAHYVAFLHAEVGDPERRESSLRSWTTCVEQFQALFGAAVAEGELEACDPAALAVTARLVLDGALIGWSIVQEGSLEDWLVARMSDAIEPYRTSNQREPAS